jgi:hypothetical protein
MAPRNPLLDRQATSLPQVTHLHSGATTGQCFGRPAQARGQQLENGCNLENCSGVCRICLAREERGGSWSRGNEKDSTLRTSKEHPRNMPGTCLLLCTAPVALRCCFGLGLTSQARAHRRRVVGSCGGCRLIRLFDGRDLPGAVEEGLVGPVEPEHEGELALGSGQPVGFQIGARWVALEVKVQGTVGI